MSYPKTLKQYGRIKRILFPSPAEREFVRVVGWWWLLFHGVRREHLVGGYVVDFAQPKSRSIVEVDGRNFHDVVADYERDQHLWKLGWRVRRIPARQIKREPYWVRKQAREFLN